MQALAAAAHECRIDMYKGRICAIVMFYVVPYIYSNILRLFLLNRKHICLCLFSFSGLVFFFFSIMHVDSGGCFHGYAREGQRSTSLFLRHPVPLFKNRVSCSPQTKLAMPACLSLLP